jgi:hypothetical protein
MSPGRVGRVRDLFFIVIFIGAVSLAYGQAGTSSVNGQVNDQQGAAVPGVTVTLTNLGTSAVRTAVTDGTGKYRILAVPPGVYSLKFELQGFRTVVYDKGTLAVDTPATMETVTLQLGELAETVQVTAEAVLVNTTDASLGNVIGGNQIIQLPLEARNPVGLMSLQAGAVYLPGANDLRTGAVSGARGDQSNVMLDGIDVNDAQTGQAYTSVLRMPLDAIQEFRVTTSNYNADLGRSSGGQVSLVTKTGTNQFRGSGYWTHRNTATSSNEYFMKLSQLQAGQESKAPKLNKHIFGGSVGGPITKDRFFFFANYEGLKEFSESPVTRAVPSDSFRDGVLIYQCANPALCSGGTVRGFASAHAVPAGFYGLTPSQLAAIDPLGIGPSLAASQYFKQYPSPNAPGLDGKNIMEFRFAAPIENTFTTVVSRLDYTIDRNARHRVFGRLNLMFDDVNNPPQFPGQPPATTNQNRNKGIGLGYDTVVGPNVVNTVRVGWTMIDEATVGQWNDRFATFRFLSSYRPYTFSNSRELPTWNFVDDLSWIKGAHTLKFGANIRITRNSRSRLNNSFSSATANGSWVNGVGRRYMPGAATCTTPGCSQVPAVAGSFAASFADPFINILGILSQSTGNYMYDRNGNPLPEGTPELRTFGANEFDFYAQDSWRLRPDVTVTAGLRYGLASPPWEVNGMQVAPNISLGKWFEQRGENAKKGIPSNALPDFSFDLAGPANGKPGFYAWDKNNFSPRLAAAWTPTASGGLLGRITGNGKLVVRGGYSLVYDRIGQALAVTFSDNSAYGLSTSLSSPVNQNNEDTPGIRFIDEKTLPPSVPAAPKGGFPATPASGSGSIYSSLDDTITTPYSHVINVAVARELRNSFSVEAAYVGRIGRNLLVRRDLAQMVNLVDPRSGVDYYTAARQVIQAAQDRGIPSGAAISAYAVIPAIAYWENLFPDAGYGGYTATQRIARLFNQYAPDYLTAIWAMDQFCFPACSIHGPYAYFNNQFDALVAQSSVARANYRSLQLTVRKRWSANYQFDVNYTLSKSEDHGSDLERGAAWGNAGYGGYSGILVNPWNIDLQWGLSDFDVRHQINANWIAALPVGRKHRFGRDLPGWANAIVGDWSMAGVLRWTSGFPFNVINARSAWATNWNVQGNAELKTPGQLPKTKTTKNAINGYPSPFPNPQEALTYFRFAYPGEVGIRNLLRGDGYFNIDFSLSKAWDIAFGTLRFRWDTFNVTNTVRFNTNGVTMFPDRQPTFGRYNSTLSTCDGRAGRCMQFALHYQF